MAVPMSMDLLPKLADLSSGKRDDIIGEICGDGLLDLMRGKEKGWRDCAYAENLDEGTRAPRFMIRRGPYKYVWSEAYPPLLFDLNEDPAEAVNLAGRSETSDIEARFQNEVNSTWDAARLKGLIHWKLIPYLLCFAAP